MQIASGLMVLGCARGTAPAGRAALPGGSGDQGGVGPGRWRGDPSRCQMSDRWCPLSGLRELVRAGARLLLAVSGGPPRGGAAGCAATSCPAVHVRRRLLRAADVRRAGRGPDPAVQPADRTNAVGAGRGRSRPGRSRWCPAGRRLRSESQPEHGPATGRRSPGAPTTGPACGRCRRVRDAQGPRLRDRAGRRRDPQAGGPAARPRGLAPSRPGWPIILGSRPSAALAPRSSPRVPALARPPPSRSPTGSTSGATSAKQPSGASPATVSASARPSPHRNRRRLRPRPRAGRRGPPDTGSPTAPAPSTSPSTRCWPPATADARSSASSA